MNEYSIMLEQKPLFWLGDRFYKVDKKAGKSTSSSQEFQAKCPSCNDARKILYKGYDGNEYEAECPVCKGQIYRGWGNRIDLVNWEVHEYIVHKVSAHGPETVSAYKGGTCCMDYVSLTAFYKFGRCMDDYIETSVPSFDTNVDRDISTINLGRASDDGEYRYYVFRNKKDAEKFCAALKEYDKQKLLEFNRKFGTAHEYPW